MSGNEDRRPLFDHYPALGAAFPFVPLAALPTPVRRLTGLGSRTPATALWLKDDGRSSPFYGGNKVRKLELLLASARASGAKTVLTFGYAGSNHATATAVHASRLGLRSVSILLPQHEASYLRKNLLVSQAVGAELHEYPSRSALVAGTLWTMLKHRLRDGSFPVVIPPGGSSPLGSLGFVNAAFELAEQVDGRLLPLPERIYVAAGSLGTVVGLGIGLAALGLGVPIHGVRVVEERYVNPSRLESLWRKTVALLRSASPEFPDVSAAVDRVVLRGEFFGGEYAVPTTESADARRLARKLDDLDLDVTYTAKTMACVLTDARSGRFPSGPVLFWNTANASNLSDLAGDVEPRNLPRRLRRYFEPDEPLDAD